MTELGAPPDLRTLAPHANLTGFADFDSLANVNTTALPE